MASSWHVARNDNQHGPYSSKQLQEMAQAGELSPTDIVWREGLKDWISASQVKGLFSASQILEKVPQQPPPIPKSVQPPAVAPSNSVIERLTSDSVKLLIRTPATIDAVVEALRESLSQIGHTSRTPNGNVSVDPGPQYCSFAAVATNMTGSVNEEQPGQYELRVNYQVKPTPACWAIGLLGGLAAVVPALILVIPFSAAKKAHRNDLDRLLRQASHTLGGEADINVEPVESIIAPITQQTAQSQTGEI